MLNLRLAYLGEIINSSLSQNNSGVFYIYCVILSSQYVIIDIIGVFIRKSSSLENRSLLSAHGCNACIFVVRAFRHSSDRDSLSSSNSGPSDEKRGTTLSYFRS